MSRVRENRMHGSMGGGRKPGQSGSHSRTAQAPPAYPTMLPGRHRRSYSSSSPSWAWATSCRSESVTSVRFELCEQACEDGAHSGLELGLVIAGSDVRGDLAHAREALRVDRADIEAVVTSVPGRFQRESADL